MKLPYGLSDFGRIRREGGAFIDKTGFLHQLESSERGRYYLVLLRPRRFGKSTLLSMLEHYYDVNRAGEFDTLFGGLEVGTNPTPERNRYLVLQLEFTGIATDRGIEHLRQSFLTKLRHQLQAFVERYSTLLPGLEAFAERSAPLEEPALCMNALLTLLKGATHPLYLLIDEYDNFTNDLIARGDQAAYTAILHGSGFVREFYKSVKEGTKDVIGRIFMTGVSPVTLDDLTSGFNITQNITLDEDFSELVGFTQEEVEHLVDGVIANGGFTLDRAQLLQDLRELYNGYLFSQDATTRVYNADMVLYFLSQLRPPASYPRELLDMNVRTDYGRMRRMLVDPDGKPRPGPIAHVQEVLQQGYIDTLLYTSFPLELAWQEEYFVSLLYYMGLLTLEAPVRRRVRLTVPNAVIERLFWENLQSLYDELSGARVGRNQLITEAEALAFEGDFEPFLRLLYTRVLSRLSNRDLLKLDEKSLKMVLLTWLAVSGVFEPWSEGEMRRGYADLILLLAREYADARWHFLIELKYLKTGQGTPERVEAKFVEAEAQLSRYRSDPRLEALRGSAGWKAIAIVFVGLEEVYWREQGSPTRKLEPEVEEG